MAAKGIEVILLDGANRFDPYMVSSFARKALIPPERLLKRIRIARAFTCYQMATLMGEKLHSLLSQEGAIRHSENRWVILLGPVTTVSGRRCVGKRGSTSLRKISEKNGRDGDGGNSFSSLPTFVSSSDFERERYLTRRLFQFSNPIWRISLEDQGPRVVLGKRINRFADCRWQIEKSLRQSQPSNE